jgi:hypothetical protein
MIDYEAAVRKAAIAKLPARSRMRGASAHCGLRCRTSVTTCSLSPMLLDAKLAIIAQAHAIAGPLEREACLLYRPELTNWPPGTHDTAPNMGVIKPPYETNDSDARRLGDPRRTWR